MEDNKPDWVEITLLLVMGICFAIGSGSVCLGIAAMLFTDAIAQR